MNKKDKSTNRVWISDIGLLIFYIACAVSIIFSPYNNYSSEENCENLKFWEIIWDSFGNAGTLIPLVCGIISFIFIRIKHKPLGWIHTCAISVGGFVLYCFYNLSIKYPIPSVIVAGVGCVTYIFFVIISLLRPENIVVKRGSVIRAAIGDRIKHSKIAGIQLYECVMTEDDNNVNYCVQAVDYLSKDDSDINGMLSVTYNLNKIDVDGFHYVTTTYQALVENGNDNIKNELIGLIEKKRSEINDRLIKLGSASDVTKNDCCLARLMIMYNAYLNILRTSSIGTASIPDAYIGESDIQNGEVIVDDDIHDRLFTLIRTGLLGGLLVGPNCIYHFFYRKNGYKLGRQYCVFHLKNEKLDTKNRCYLCVVVIKEVTDKILPPYVLQAIRKMIPKLEKSLDNFIQEVDG